MAILEFIFSGFWVFFGTLILLGILLDGIANIIRAARGKP